jgi:pimeloyl-ACP methyl ester carboxylesterase
VGQRLAIDNPERVKSLMLYGSTPGLTRSQVSTWVPRMGAIGIRPFLAETISDRFPVDAVDPRFVEWFLDEAAKNDLPFIQRFVGHMSTVDMMEEIRAIRCPVMMIAPGAEPVGHAARLGRDDNRRIRASMHSVRTRSELSQSTLELVELVGVTKEDACSRHWAAQQVAQQRVDAVGEVKNVVRAHELARLPA